MAELEDQARHTSIRFRALSVAHIALHWPSPCYHIYLLYGLLRISNLPNWSKNSSCIHMWVYTKHRPVSVPWPQKVGGAAEEEIGSATEKDVCLVEPETETQTFMILRIGELDCLAFGDTEGCQHLDRNSRVLFHILKRVKVSFQNQGQVSCLSSSVFSAAVVLWSLNQSISNSAAH